MERSMGVSALSEDGLTAEYVEQDKSGLQEVSHVHEDEPGRIMRRNTDSIHMHMDMDVKDHHTECPPSTVHMHMDVIDHHNTDCPPPPPTIDSSDTSLASPRSSLDPHPYPPDFLSYLQGSDPVKEELDRLQNEVKEKNRELIEARTEIKALKTAERSREKALEELADELARVDERLGRAELLLESKNLELKRMSEDKKEAQAAQHAAEAIVRRIQAAHMRDEEMPPIEAILAPLDAELKLTRQEVVRLQEDNRVLDRLTKSKEAALLEAEKTVQIANAKASMVEDLQNKNQELVKHIELCQEENKVLDKLYRQKITEVEKLSMRIAELEEALLSSGLNEANAARDYQRQLQDLLEEKRALERELARAKIVANRVSAVIANGWKGSNDKVMPVKHWLEERRVLQSEMEQLRQKLASMERAAKAEAILKEKFQIRLKVLEESVMLSAPPRTSFRSRSPTCATEAAATPIIASQSALKPVKVSRSSLTRNGAIAGTRISISNRWASGINEQDSSRDLDANNVDGTDVMTATSLTCCTDVKHVMANHEHTDYVSGQLYDLLQKEVVMLRKACQQKEQGLLEKDNIIEMLERKVSLTNRSMEIESKKVRREVAALEKEVSALRSSVNAASPRLPLNKHKKNPQLII